MIVNRVQTDSDSKAGEAIHHLMRQYLSISTSVVMTIREDDAIKDVIAVIFLMKCQILD